MPEQRSIAAAPRELLEFFRPDVSRAVRRALVPATLLLTVGPPLLLFSATAKQIRGHAVVGFVGAALLVLGLVIGLPGVLRLVLEDHYVGVTREGLVIHLTSEETFLPWDEIDRVRHEAGDLLVEVREGTTMRFLFGGQAEQVAARLDDWRRKSAWNLAPPPRS